MDDLFEQLFQIYPPKRKGTEIWKQIDGFPNHWVSEAGHIYSTFVNRELKPWGDRFGYKTVTLKRNKAVRVHRIVAMAFLPNPECKPCVLHKDGDHRNNDFSNLYWGTKQDNQDDMARHGTRLKGERVNGSKLTNEQVVYIRNSDKTPRPLGRELGVTRHTIQLIRKRKIWTHI